MVYNLNGLTSLPDIQSMLESANREKTDLLGRKEFLETRLASTESHIAATANDMIEVDNRIATYTAELATLAAGTVEYMRKQVDLYREQARKISLEVRAMGPGYRESVRQERLHDVAVIDLIVPEIDAFIAALTARQSEIQGS